MRFKVRSLGGKLVVVTALTLLLCLLLFTVASWGLLKYYSEHVARSDAFQHLTLLKREYQAKTTLLLRTANGVASDSRVVAVTSRASTQPTQNHIQSFLSVTVAQNYLSTLLLVSKENHTIDSIPSGSMLDGERTPLVEQALHGYTVSSLQKVIATTADVSSQEQWNLVVAVPVHDTTGIVGVVLIAKPLDDSFAQSLIVQTDSDILLCIAGHVVAGTSVKNALHGQAIEQRTVCTPHTENFVGETQHYLTMTDVVPLGSQFIHSPSLTIVDVEQLYTVNTHSQRLVLLVIGIGITIFALGVVALTFVTRTFFIQPLRQLQTRIRTLVADTPDTQPAVSGSDELTMLSRSFSLLSESLESESQAMTEQMSNILIMSDALISTLNLEHLLGEIVSRLGRIMQAKDVSLLLYGREMLSPWAVAQWSAPVDTQTLHTTAPLTPGASHSLSTSLPSLPALGAVTVHADPDGDITMAATTKLVAIPGSARTASHGKSGISGKRNAVRTPKSSADAPPYGIRRPRIPRPALRDMDMILARMVIQRQKIAYGENIATIQLERNEPWARMAREAGYLSVIAVPLMLQDQSIGAFILYSDKPYQVSSRDTFLLSTAAIQASMAIQNALLFAEVKDKNAALERANQLKSQFLANVTHELRTPLHSIISYGALILEGFVDGELTKEQEEHIQFIVNRAEDLSHLVDDMLDLSKIEADHLEVKTEPMDLAPSLQEVVSQLKPLANNKALQLSLEADVELPLVLADSHRIRQIVINLVSNAIKFTEKGSVTITCTLTQHGDMVRVSVHDTGIGISPAALGYIFEAFRQADGSTTRRFGGTGLGLTIAKKLIELQGGEVMVESVVGQSSTFSFLLPVASPSKGRLMSFRKQR